MKSRRETTDEDIERGITRHEGRTINFFYDEEDLPPRFKMNIRRIIKDFARGVVDPDFLRFFNRDPERSIPRGSGVIVAPADGILQTRETEDRLIFRIFIRYTDVHFQRVPLPGIVRAVREGGRGYSEPDDKRHLDNVQVATEIESELGIYTVRQITTWTTRRIKNSLQPGQHVELGQKLGKILLGSTAVLELPKKCVELEAAELQRVYAGETILARFSPKNDEPSS